MFNKKNQQPEEGIIRVRIPKSDETLGIVTALLGGGRLEVKCEDGKIRICRIPGKMKKKIWIRLGNLILIKPWSVQSDERGDVIWLYSRAQADWLKSKGFVKNVASELQ